MTTAFRIIAVAAFAMTLAACATPLMPLDREAQVPDPKELRQ